MSALGRSMLRIAGFGLIAFGLAFIGSSYAKDRDVKDVIRTIEKKKLDDACKIRVDHAKSGGAISKDFDLVIEGFPGHSLRGGEKVFLDSCEEIGGQIHCVSSDLSEERDGKWNLCKLRRLVLNEGGAGIPSRLSLGTIEFRIKDKKDKKNCAIEYLKGHVDDEKATEPPRVCEGR